MIFSNSPLLIQRDLRHLWHPCSQMKDYEDFPPLMVNSAKGNYLLLENGHRILDAVSSWWCKSLGHGHPRLKHALFQQAEHFEHVILANTTNNVIVNLSEKLALLSPRLDKILYANDGSCAVEMAMKLSAHVRVITGQMRRKNFIALSNSYHGETLGALSVSDVGIFRRPYESLLFETTFIKNIPYVTGIDDPLWHDCSHLWPVIENQLQKVIETTTAVIVEPLIQAGAGMLIYSPDFLRRLREWTVKHDIHLIVDEIMTGLGRTGLPLASQHAHIEADFLCLGKGLTAGWLPMSAVLTSTSTYQLFYDDYEKGKNFLHSHTYSGNVLAAAVALENLTIMEEENIYSSVQQQASILRHHMLEVAEKTQKLKNVRSLGFVVAADLMVEKHPRAGFAVYKEAVKRGVLLRPLGNTIYWTPPLNSSNEIFQELKNVTIEAINEVLV